MNTAGCQRAGLDETEESHEMSAAEPERSKDSLCVQGKSTSELLYLHSREGNGTGCILDSLGGSVLSPCADGASGISSVKSGPERSGAVRVGDPLSCDSHVLPMFRVEGDDDSTPLLHRTHNSVWKSYSARNLRSLRDGSYSDASLNQCSSSCCGSVSSNQEELSENRVVEARSLPQGGSYSSSYSCGHIQDSESDEGNKPQERKLQDNSESRNSCENKAKETLHFNRPTVVKSVTIEDQEEGRNVFSPFAYQHESSQMGNNLLSCSHEKERGVLSALDESLGEIRQSRPHSITASTDLDLSSDFSSHFQKDRNLNSTRLSMDFGQSKISLDFGPELKDLSHLSGLSRLPLIPLHTNSSTDGKKVGAVTTAIPGSLPYSKGRLGLPSKKLDGSLRRKMSDQLTAPGSGGELFRRRLSKPGLRRVLSDTFDKCLLSDSSKNGSSALRKNLLECKSKSQEIGDCRESFQEKDLKEEKGDGVSARSTFQRKRSLQDAQIEISPEVSEPKIQCKLNRPQHSGLTPDLRRLAMRNHVQNNRSESGLLAPANLMCNLFRASPRSGISPLVSPGLADSFEGNGSEGQNEMKSVDQMAWSSQPIEGLCLNHTGLTCEIDALRVKDVVSGFSQDCSNGKGSDSSNQMDQLQQNSSETEQMEVKKHSTSVVNSEGNESIQLALHRVSACTNLAVHYDHNIPPSPQGHNEFGQFQPPEDTVGLSSGLDSPKAKRVKFYVDSPSPGPTMHSSPAAGSDGSRLKPPPLIIQKGVSTNDSLGHDGSFLNTSIEFEATDGKAVTTSPKNISPMSKENLQKGSMANDMEAQPQQLTAFFEQPTSSEMEVSKSAVRQRSRSSSSNSSNLSDIAPADDHGGISPGRNLSAAVHHLPSPPITFSQKSPQPTSDSDQDLCSPSHGSCRGQKSSGPSEAECQVTNKPDRPVGHRCHGDDDGSLRGQRSCPSLVCHMPSIAEGNDMQEREAEQGHKMDCSVFSRPISMVSKNIPLT